MFTNDDEQMMPATAMGNRFEQPTDECKFTVELLVCTYVH
jgi:hypothetical protein